MLILRPESLLWDIQCNWLANIAGYKSVPVLTQSKSCMSLNQRMTGGRWWIIRAKPFKRCPSMSVFSAEVTRCRPWYLRTKNYLNLARPRYCTTPSELRNCLWLCVCVVGDVVHISTLGRKDICTQRDEGTERMETERLMKMSKEEQQLLDTA